VVAPGNLKQASCVRKFALLDIFYPGSGYPQGNLILRFTGHTAGMTANTGAVVDHKAIVHLSLPVVEIWPNI
jgi:hypothetical protein